MEFRTSVESLEGNFSINNAFNPINLGTKWKLLISRFQNSPWMLDLESNCPIQPKLHVFKLQLQIYKYRFIWDFLRFTLGSVFLSYLCQFSSKFKIQGEFWNLEIKSFHLAPRFMGLNALLMEKSARKDLTEFILSWL